MTDRRDSGRTNPKGLMAGTAILFVGYVVWGIAIYMKAVTPIFNTAFLAVPLLAGFAASWLAPRGQLAPTVLLALPAAVFAGSLNFILQLAGSDTGFYSGATGSLRVAAFTVLSAGLFCAVGGLLAVIARQVRGTA